MDLQEARIYDPRCDSPDVALRAVAQKVESDRFDLLETAELDWQSVRSKARHLTDTYGSFYSRRWHDPEMMKLLRRYLPELIPVAQSWQMLYVLVTRTETKKRRIA